MNGQDKSSSLVRRTAHELRVLVSKCEPGGLLGFEDDLLTVLGVSRPTLRQAAALVAQEQLLTVRRGGSGGYFARIPTSKAVAHAASIYLEAHRVSLEEVMRAVEPTGVEMIRLAARHCTGKGAAELRACLERDRGQAVDQLTFVDFLRGQQAFDRAIG